MRHLTKIRHLHLFSTLFAFTFTLTIFAADASAQSFDRSVRTSAMGGAGAANSRGTDAVNHNVANIAVGPNYLIEAGYVYRKNSHTMGASIVDSKTNPMVAAAVGYSFVLGSNDLDGVQGHDVHFGIAVPILANRLSLGVGGRYTWLKQKIKNQKEKIELINGFNLNAGFNLRIVDQLLLGFAANNLIPQCDKVECKAFLPMTFSQGLSYSNWGFSVALDVDVDIDRAKDPAIDIGTGIEYVVAEMVPIRLGYRNVDVFDQNLVTVGTGFTSEYVDVNLTYQIDVSHTDFHYVFANIALKL